MAKTLKEKIRTRGEKLGFEGKNLEQYVDNALRFLGPPKAKKKVKKAK